MFLISHTTLYVRLYKKTILNLHTSMIKTLKILIIDDHELVRGGIKAMLKSVKKYRFKISEAECCEDALDMVATHDFDIILVDYQLPDSLGPETITQIKKVKPKAKTLALSNYDEYTCIKNMIKAGANGYVLKNISPAELIKAIETILDEKKYYSGDVAKQMKIFRRKKLEGSYQQKKYGLSNRQLEILRMIYSGMTNEDISLKLNLAKRTIDTHRYNMILKFGVKNTAALINKAIEVSIL